MSFLVTAFQGAGSKRPPQTRRVHNTVCMNSIDECFSISTGARGSAAILQLDGFVRAGFPSPAEDFAAKRIELSDLLVEHPQATYIMRVRGVSALDFGIDDLDWVVVDRAIRPRHRHLVIAEIDGDFTLKRFFNLNGVMKLQAGNPDYPDIVPKGLQELQIWGVVRNSIKTHI